MQEVTPIEYQGMGNQNSEGKASTVGIEEI
jgi:hypothetical protein